MKFLTLILALSISSVAHAERTNLHCDAVFQCPNGCWGVTQALKFESKTVVIVDHPVVWMDLELMEGQWLIEKETDSRIFFRRNISDIEMVGSLNRYTGELILHNESWMEDGRWKTYSPRKNAM